MGTTNLYGWPYPEPTDPVRDGAQDIEDLAVAISNTLNQRIGGMMVQAGSSVVSLNASGDCQVNLGTAFAVTPVYLGQVSDPVVAGGFYMISPYNQYATVNALPFRIFSTNGGNPGTGPLRVNWIAIGVAP